MKSTLVLGIMSGTSLGSVDYALCAVNPRCLRLEDHWQVDFPDALQRRLNRAARGEANSYELAQLHHDLGRFYARHASRRWRQRGPQLVGLHGQTLFHNPCRPRPATFQAGEPAYLVETLRVPVVSNFRAADLAAGGQGAPLATVFHRLVFARAGRHVCVNNLGGISNVTSIDWTLRSRPVVKAFDTGPANLLLDLAMRHLTHERQSLDRDGAWAARGRACEHCLRAWLKLAYFRKKPPKSTGREMFGEAFFNRALTRMRQAGLSPADMMATLTEFTARSLALNYRLHLGAKPERVILTGGGAANLTLVQKIRQELQRLASEAEVVTVDQLGWPVQAVEPAAFALLAYLRKRGLPGNLPATTGARRGVLLGQLSEPV